MAGWLQHLAGRCYAGLGPHKIDAHSVAVEHRASRRGRVRGPGAATLAACARVKSAALCQSYVKPSARRYTLPPGTAALKRTAVGYWALFSTNDRYGAGAGAAAVSWLANRHKAEPASS